MARGVTVMDLVLGRAVQHMFQLRAERQPDMAMPQVGRQAVEDEHQVGHAEQGVAADFTAAEVPEASGVEADANACAQFLDDLFHEMHPARCRRHQHGRRMMDFVKGPEPAGVKGPVRPVMDEVLEQEHPQPVEQGQCKVLAQARARAPEVAEKGQVIAGAQDVGVDQLDDGQHQCNLEDGPHEVVAVVQQRRRMQMYPGAADELPERLGVAQAALLPEAEQAIGCAIGDAKEQGPETAIHIENAEKLVGNRRDHPIGQVLIDKRQGIHETSASAKGTQL